MTKIQGNRLNKMIQIYHFFYNYGMYDGTITSKTLYTIRELSSNCQL